MYTTLWIETSLNLIWDTPSSPSSFVFVCLENQNKQTKRAHFWSIEDTRLICYVWTFSEKTTGSKWIHVEPSVCPSLSSSISYSDVSEIKQVRILNWQISARPRWGPNQFSHYFHTIIFFLVPHLTWDVSTPETLQVHFTASLGLLSSHHYPQKPVSLPFFFSSFSPWPCNLFLFLSSMVPTQKSGAQRKKLMNLRFPLKTRKLSLLGFCTLSGPAAVSEFHTLTTGQFRAHRSTTCFISLPVCLLIVQHIYSTSPLSISSPFGNHVWSS